MRQASGIGVHCFTGFRIETGRIGLTENGAFLLVEIRIRTNWYGGWRLASGSFGPTTAGQMDPNVPIFQGQGASMVMLAKSNPSCHCFQGDFIVF